MKKIRAGNTTDTSKILAQLQDRIEEALDSMASERLASDGYGALDRALDAQIKKAKKRLQKAG